MKLIVEVGKTSIHIVPNLFTGQFLLHYWLHFFGLHLSGLMIAIRRTSPFDSSIIYNIRDI
jgi:hypothetical protein